MRCSPLLLALALFPAAAHGWDIKRTDQFLDKTSSVHEDELFVIAQGATLGGSYSDDVVAVASGQLSLSGRFANDVWGLGTQIDVKGAVGDHLRLGGNSINLDGRVASRLDAVGNSIQLGERAEVGGGAWLIGDSVVVAGNIQGPLHITAQNVTLSGHVVGPMYILAEDIVVLPTARLEGDLAYESQRELVLDPSVHPSGALQRGLPRSDADRDLTASEVFQAEIIMRGYWFVAAILVGWPIAAIFPRFMGRSVRLVRLSSIRCGFTGAAAFCLLPMAAVLVAFTVVGLPLAAFVLGLYGALLYLSQFVIALAAGSALLRWRGHQSLARVLLILVVGLLLLYILTALPIVGLACGLATAFLGLGALLLSLFTRDEPAPPPLPAEPPVVT